MNERWREGRREGGSLRPRDCGPWRAGTYLAPALSPAPSTVAGTEEMLRKYVQWMKSLNSYLVTQVPSWLLGIQRGNHPDPAFKKLAVWGREPDMLYLGGCDGSSPSCFWELEEGGGPPCERPASLRRST